MDEIRKTEESTGATRHFLYYIFAWDREENPMPAQKVSELLTFLHNVLRKERKETWKDRNS